MPTAKPSGAGPAGPIEPLEDRGRSDAVPGWTRWFVRSFLAAFVVCAIFGLDAWPLTGWRLFSHLRSEHVVSWQVTAVDPSGAETLIQFKDLGAGYRGAQFIARDFASLPPLDRVKVCEAWARTIRRVGRPVVAFRIYRVNQSLLPRAHGRAAGPATRMIEYECTVGGSTS